VRPTGFSSPPARAWAWIAFESIASPAAFEADPLLGWGFYGHRLALYRRTEPHEGFAILKQFGESMPNGVFVFTSNVDGQFDKDAEGRRPNQRRLATRRKWCPRMDNSIAVWNFFGLASSVDQNSRQ